MARGCRAPLAQTVLKNKEGRDLANSLSLSAFLRGSTRWEEQHTPTAAHPKSPRCQQLRDTLASAAWSHPRGTLRGAELHLGSCRARNPSQGPPAAHAAVKSVPLAAAKTIREAASPHCNPGCVITLPAPRRERSPGEPSRAEPRGTSPCLRAPGAPAARVAVPRNKGHSLLGTRLSPRAAGLSSQPARTRRRQPRGFSPWHSCGCLTERGLY